VTRTWASFVFAALLGVAVFVYGEEQRKRGAAEADDRRAAAVIDSIATAGARVDTVWRVQVDTFYVRRQRVDTLTRTVELWKRDTLRVVEYVQQADSTIRACSALVVTCEERGALYRAELQAWARRWDARPKPPSRLEEAAEAAMWAAAGWLLRGLVAP